MNIKVLIAPLHSNTVSEFTFKRENFHHVRGTCVICGICPQQLVKIRYEMWGEGQKLNGSICCGCHAFAYMNRDETRTKNFVRNPIWDEKN